MLGMEKGFHRFGEDESDQCSHKNIKHGELQEIWRGHTDVALDAVSRWGGERGLPIEE